MNKLIKLIVHLSLFFCVSMTFAFSGLRGALAGQILHSLVEAGADFSCRTQRCAVMVRELWCIQSSKFQECEMKVQGRGGFFQKMTVEGEKANKLFLSLSEASAPMICDSQICELQLHEVSCFGNRDDLSSVQNQCTIR